MFCAWGSWGDLTRPLCLAKDTIPFPGELMTAAQRSAHLVALNTGDSDTCQRIGLIPSQRLSKLRVTA